MSNLTILDAIRDQLALVTIGQLPACNTDAEFIAMYREQEAVLAVIAAETYRLRAEIVT